MRTSPAFLSVRVPTDLRGRLKSVAAKRGISLQQLMRTAIQELLAREEAQPPKLAEVIAKLREHAPALRQRGVEHLYVFGSLARGEAGIDSDIDLAIDVDPASRFSLVTQASIGLDLEELLQRRVDIGARTSLRSSLREDFERDAVQVF
jgi:predicted nucleotidyltransferase